MTFDLVHHDFLSDLNLFKMDSARLVVDRVDWTGFTPGSNPVQAILCSDRWLRLNAPAYKTFVRPAPPQ